MGLPIPLCGCLDSKRLPISQCCLAWHMNKVARAQCSLPSLAFFNFSTCGCAFIERDQRLKDDLTEVFSPAAHKSSGICRLSDPSLQQDCDTGTRNQSNKIRTCTLHSTTEKHTVDFRFGIAHTTLLLLGSLGENSLIRFCLANWRIRN